MIRTEQEPSSGRLSSPLRRHCAWALVLGLAGACEREAATPASSPPTSEPAAPTPSATGSAAPVASPTPPPAKPAPAVAAAPEPAPPATPTPTPDPTIGDPAQVARVLDEYHRIERFLRPRPEDRELADADAKRLREFLGEKRFAGYETDGSAETIRKAWLERMSAAAAREAPSILRMPLYPNVGWGCEVPSVWVATGNFDPDVTFIMPVGDTTLVDRCMECFELEARDRCVEQRCDLQVQGHFTGTTTKPTEHCEDIGHEFHIERATANGAKPSPFFLALPGGSPAPDGPPITEGPRWGVLFASAFRHEKDARARADALRARLVEKGFATAEVLDSRRIPTLWCCSFAVLVERLETETAAKALAQRLKREGFDGMVARTLY